MHSQCVRIVQKIIRKIGQEYLVFQVPVYLEMGIDFVWRLYCPSLKREDVNR